MTGNGSSSTATGGSGIANHHDNQRIQVMTLTDCPCESVAMLRVLSAQKPTVGLLDLEQLTDEAMGEGNLGLTQTGSEMKDGFDEQPPYLVKTEGITNLMKLEGNSEQSAYSEGIPMNQDAGQTAFTNLLKSDEGLLKSDGSQTSFTNLMKSDADHEQAAFASFIRSGVKPVGTDGLAAYSNFIKGGVSGPPAFPKLVKSSENDDLSGCPVLMKSEDTSSIPIVKMEETSSIPTLRMEETSSIPTLKMEETSSIATLKMEETSSIPSLKPEETCPIAHHPKLSMDDDDDCPPAPTLELVLVDQEMVPMSLDCPSSEDGGPPRLDLLESHLPDSIRAGLDSRQAGCEIVDEKLPVGGKVLETSLMSTGGTNLTGAKVPGTSSTSTGTQQGDTDSCKSRVSDEKLTLFESKIGSISEKLAIEANELRHCHVALDRVEIPGTTSQSVEAMLLQGE
ncbi:hypothetical protein WDU94_010465 [Cyamophila willieti]